jgi:hypothetical protein
MGFPSFNAGEVLTAADMNAVGLWKVTTATVTAQPTLTVDNCFSANYANYRVIVRLNGVSNNNQMRMDVLNSAGTRLQTNYAGSFYGQDYSTGTTGFEGLQSSVTVPLGYLSNASAFGPSMFAMDIVGPFTSGITTLVHGTSNGVDAGRIFLGGQIISRRLAAETNRGLFFFNSVGSNMTGTVSVYGYRD